MNKKYSKIFNLALVCGMVFGSFFGGKVGAEATYPDCSAVMDVNVSPTSLGASNNTANINISITPSGVNGACSQGGTTRTSLLLFVSDGKASISQQLPAAVSVDSPSSYTYNFKPSDNGWNAGDTVPITVKVSTDPSGNVGNLTSQDLATRTVTVSIASAAQQAQTNVPTTNLTPSQTQTQTPTTQSDLSKILNGCVNETNGDAYLKGPCGDVTIFIDLMLRIISYLFGIIGGVALLFFVYGGFMFILSAGNAERVEKGKAIILTAVLGIAIAFGGYALVKFAGDAVGLKPTYGLQ